MEELLASQTFKAKSLEKGQQVEGTIVALLENEAIIDLGAKSEGIIGRKDLPNHDNLKVGDKIKAYVVAIENDEGQVVLSSERVSLTRGGRSSDGGPQRAIAWSRLTQAKSQNKKLTGPCVEVNKGGIIIELEGIRGFLPSSQIGEGTIKALTSSNGDLIGKDIEVTVIEVLENNNRLILSQKGNLSEEQKAKFKNLKNGQKISGKVLAVLPFGLLVSLDDDLYGVVYAQDVSWEKVEDLGKLFQVGQAVEAIISSVEQDLGRLTLTLKNQQDDPFQKIAEKYKADDVVKGTVTEVSQTGATIKLEDGTEGFVPTAKIEQPVEVGQTLSLIVDSVDKNKRKVNLVPFVTTTKGLIYK